MKDYRILFLCIIGAIFMSLLFCVQRYYSWHINKGRSQNISRTLNGMYAMAMTIQMLEDRKFTTMNDLLINLDQYDLEYLIIKTGDTKLSSGVYHDAWGIPIQLICDTDEEWTFVSFGPNKRDDNHMTDDIVYSFNPQNIITSEN